MSKNSKKAQKLAKKHPKIFITLLIILLIAVGILVAIYFIKPSIYHQLIGIGEHTWSEWTTKEPTCGKAGKRSRTCIYCNDEDIEILPATNNHSFNDEKICTVCGYDGNKPTEADVLNAELSIHFLELGNKFTGDCTLIKYGDTEILIDAGSRQNSATTITQYIDKYCADKTLEYVIATHAHQDHIAGFVGSKENTGILYNTDYTVGTIIQFSGHNTNSDIYNSYCSAVEFAEGRGTTVYTAKECWYQTGNAKRTYYLDSENKVSLNILYQKFYEEQTSDENDYSVCVLLTDSTGSTPKNFLFTGDLEAAGEASLAVSNALPEVELFKGGHHGSYTASTDALLSVIKPKNVAVCCCCGTTEYTKNPANTFPAQEFIDRVAKYTENIYCTTLIIDYAANDYTSMNGNIVFFVSGEQLRLYCSANDLKLKDTDWFKENRKWNV